MSKLWLVAKYEYVRDVFKKNFVLLTLSVPLILAISVGLGWLIHRMENPDAPVGYVDHAGVLTDPIPPWSSPGPLSRCWRCSSVAASWTLACLETSA